MKVYKFGGSVLKDAQGLRSLLQILKSEENKKNLVLVVSAMGKTTNALEKITDLLIQTGQIKEALDNLKNFHLSLIEQLYEDKKTKLSSVIEAAFLQFEECCYKLRKIKEYNQLYDQLIPFGEIISSLIVNQWLNESGVKCEWIDVHKIIRTDTHWREANINWEITSKKIKGLIQPLIRDKIIVTQGFVGGTANEEYTTLGREGSDYSAAVFAHCLQAEQLVIWKDVPGVLSADPKKYPEAELISELSYADAAELAKYGASVIHPKTIAPVATRNIPLMVKHFMNPNGEGTLIQGNSSRKFLAEVIIFKENQVWVSIQVEDFHFMDEEEIAGIFRHFAEVHMNSNFIHKTATSLLVCTDYRKDKVDKFKAYLDKTKFRYSFTEKATLITIKNPSEELIKKLTFDKEILLNLRQKNFCQIIVNDNRE